MPRVAFVLWKRPPYRGGPGGRCRENRAGHPGETTGFLTTALRERFTTALTSHDNFTVYVRPDGIPP